MSQTPTNLPQSPALAEADPQWSITELFNQSPLALTREQFALLIAELRAQALRNALAEASGQRLGNGVNGSATKVKPLQATNQRAEDLL